MIRFRQGRTIEPPTFVGPTSPYAMNGYLAGNSTPASAGWPAANKAIYYPIRLPAAWPVKRLWWVNGATTAGAWSVAIIRRSDLARLVTSGAVTQAGVNVPQFASVDVVLPPGDYLVGGSASLTTTTIWRHTLTGVDHARIAGQLEQLTAHPIPDPAVPVQMTSNFLGYFGLSTVTGP